MAPIPIARSTRDKPEMPIMEDAINAFAAKMALMYKRYSKGTLHTVITSSDDVLYQQAKKNSGTQEFPILGIRFESAMLNAAHYNPRILYRQGISLRDVEGTSFKVFHLLPVKLTMNVKFLCKSTQDRDAFMKGWLYNLVENNVSFDFEDESSEKTFRINMRVQTTEDISAGVFDKDTEIGILNTMEASVDVYTYAGKFGRIKAIDSISLSMQIGSLSNSGGYFDQSESIHMLDRVVIVEQQGSTPRGQTVIIQQIPALASPIPIEVGTGFIEQPLANETLLLYSPVNEITLDHNLCVARCRTPATAQTIFTVYKNEIEIATFTFDPGDTDSTLIMTPILVNRKINPGDTLEIRAPAVADSTIANITFTMGGFKPSNVNMPTTVEICTGIVEKPIQNETLLIYSPVVPVVLDQSLSISKTKTPATDTTVFSIIKNNTEIGTVTFAPGATNGVLILNASSVVRRLNVTDFLVIKAPALEDPTLANITFTLVGYK